MRWILISALAIVLVLDIGFGWRSAHYEVSSSTKYNAKESKEERTIEGPFVIGLRNAATWLLEFSAKNDKAITALSTLVIAIFTVVLAWATVGLWKMAVRQSSDTRESLRIARESADAAKESADSVVAAAMPILYPYITDMQRLHPLTLTLVDEALTRDSNNFTHEANIFIGFDNYGKKPAIIRQVNAELFLTVKDQLPVVDVNELPVHNYPVWVPGEARGKDLITGALDLKQMITFTREELREVLSAGTGQFRRFVLIGKVIYDDFFGNRHTSRFCVKVRLWPGIAVDSVPQVHTFQVAQGGSRYNNITTEQIPKPDPLAQS